MSRALAVTAADKDVSAQAAGPILVQRGPGDPRGSGLPGLPGFGPPSRTKPLPARPEVVELKGTSQFRPSPELSDHIKAQAGAPVFVKVRFGALAEGQIPVYWNSTGFRTTDPDPNFPAWGLPFRHHAMPVTTQAHPTLWVVVQDSVVSGSLGWTTAAALARDPGKFRQHIPRESIFGGMAGFTNLRFPGEVVSQLAGGSVLYDAPALTFDAGLFHGHGWLRIKDETYDFEAAIDVPLTGLPGEANVPIRRSPSDSGNPVFGTQSWRYQRSLGGKQGVQIAGDITATLGNGSLDIRGTARYASTKPRINGTVTIIVDSFERAKKAVVDRLGPDAPSSTDPATGGEAVAVTGFGQLDFTYSSWMTGNAEMILHPDGYVSARGELLPTKVIPLARKREKRRTIVEKGFTRLIGGVIGIGDVRAKGNATLSAYGWFGPGTLHGIRLNGLVSNHPGIVNRLELGGTISAPAAAGLTLSASAGLSAKLAHIKEIARMGISARGNLELQMYAEAGAAVGRRPSATGSGEPEYFLDGHLDASAALDLDLQLWLGGRVIFLAGKIDLIDQTWTLGSGGMRLDFEYVIGKAGQSKVTTDVGKIDFDPGAFVEAVVRGKTVEAKGYQGKKGVAAEAESDVVNPAAPVPVGPGVTPAVPTERVVEAAFDMVGESHTLRLAVVDPPALDMASKTPGRLLRKIKAARDLVRKTPDLPPDLAAARLGDLKKIEDAAKAVLAAAEKVAEAEPYLTPSVPGFPELAVLISGYATRHQATDLLSGLAAVSVDPAKPETVLNKFPALAADPLLTARVARLLESGVDVGRLRKIVDNHPPRAQERLVDLLQYLETMVVHGAVNWETVVEDLAIGGNKMKGATFVLRFIDTYLSWDAVIFEDKGPQRAGGSGRRWDAWVGGTIYEFKSWHSWTGNTTFLKQMLYDYTEIIGEKKLGLLWVFDESGMSKDYIIERMEEALDEVTAAIKQGVQPKVNGYTLALCAEIKSHLRSVVKTVVFPKGGGP